MEKEIASGQIGSDGSYKVEFKDGSLKAECGYMAGVKAGVSLEIPVDFVLDAIKNAIPGKVDDAVIEMLKGALKA